MDAKELKKQLKLLKLPRNQEICVRYTDNDVLKYLSTKNTIKEEYILYSVASDLSLTKIATSKLPYFKEVGD